MSVILNTRLIGDNWRFGRKGLKFLGPVYIFLNCITGFLAINDEYIPQNEATKLQKILLRICDILPAWWTITRWPSSWLIFNTKFNEQVRVWSLKDEWVWMCSRMVQCFWSMAHNRQAWEEKWVCCVLISAVSVEEGENVVTWAKS